MVPAPRKSPTTITKSGSIMKSSNTGESCTTIGMTAGDTFEFWVRPAQAGFKHDVGTVNTEFATVSAVAYPKKKNSLFRAVALHKFVLKPIAIEIGKDYSKYTISSTLQYDSTKDAVFSFIK